MFAMSDRASRWEDEDKSSNDFDVWRKAIRRRFLAKGERVSLYAPSLAVELNCTDTAEQVCTEPRGVGLRTLETV